jgi:amino acid transporter
LSEPKLQKKLTLFDVTNLVIGAIIGADIYVASSFGAGYLGPFSLIVWIMAGIIAIVIALCFAQCAAMIPKVGGPYAYAKEAWGPFAGFAVGWSLWNHPTTRGTNLQNRPNPNKQKHYRSNKLNS